MFVSLMLRMCLVVALCYILSPPTSTDASSQYPKKSVNSLGSFLITSSRDAHGHSYASSFLKRFKRSVTPPTIESLAVVSRVTSRFAQTTYRGIISNHANESQEAQFTVFLPETAFISNFTMLIDNKLYVAEVKSKEDAQKDYENAKREHKTAGQVTADDSEDKIHGMEAFTTFLNVAAGSSIEVTLSYQELIKRRLGTYTILLSIRPNQIVEELSADVYICEPEGIRFLDVKEPGSNSKITPNTEIIQTSDKIKHINYSPSMDRQREANWQMGIKGDLVITYDVYHSNDAGLVVVEEDHFLHYFSPDGRDPLPKNIVFVIDISGSMKGDKMEQTREALLVILDQLRTGDKFQILIFDDEIETWPKNELTSVTENTISEAKKYVDKKVKASGYTNINDALVTAANTLSKYGASMIVFLTDGQPSAGQTDPKKIVENVVAAAQGKITIFSLGFGYNLNFELLEMLAYRTGGDVRTIYEDDTADGQLQNFFMEVGTPVLYDVTISYTEQAVVSQSTTRTQFSEYFNGSEIVVAGKLQEKGPNTWTVEVVGKTTEQETLTKTVNTEEAATVPPEANEAVTSGFAEKLYVYLKIKDLLRQTLIVDDVKAKADLKKKALNLALEYKLVTPVTSMIIVHDESQKEKNPNKVYAMASGSACNLQVLEMIPYSILIVLSVMMSR